jgi:nucleoside phosphorylase
MKSYIAVVYSIDQEILFFKRALLFIKQEVINKRKILFYRLKDKEIILCKIGVGSKNIEKNLNMINENYNISKIILIGFAGALDKRLKIGDCILPVTVRNNDTQEEISVKTGKKGVLNTVSDIFCKKEKFELKQKHKEILAVDMESFYFAQWQKKQGKEIFIIKSISDSFNFIMPEKTVMLKYFNRIPLCYSSLLDFFKSPIEFIRLLKLKLFCLIAGFRLYKGLISTNWLK